MKRVILATLAAFAAVLSFMLWPAWRYNPDVSHGLFMPVVFIFLIHHSRTAGPRRYLPSGAGVLAASSCTRESAGWMRCPSASKSSCPSPPRTTISPSST